ncbi:MAG: flippase-like domain-containing protein [Nocardioidaceae bacterium]|nr:flippase-like domain-containing protein [Nocardioidaceae bacterium]
MAERLRIALRVAFLAAVLVFAWASLRGRWDEIGSALRQTSALGLAGALALVLLGLLATGFLWLLLMSRLDASVPVLDGLAIFFLGQLGKYIPGSVWSIGAQADLARRHDVPPRATVAAGLLFLGYHVDTALLAGSATVLTGGLDADWPDQLFWLALAAGLVGLVPGVVRLLGQRVAGRDVRIDVLATLRIVLLLAVAWASYAGALVLLVPGAPWGDLVALGGAFALGYAVGVVVVLAPAGVGARETVFVLLLTPVLGVGPATALALLARVVHTVADAVMALGWWATSRGGARVQPSLSSTSS